MTVTLRRLPRAVVFTNDVASWTVWTAPTSDGSRFVGAGYLGRVRLLNGKTIVDDFRHDSNSPHVNDPSGGGLGAFGVHIARRNHHYPDPAQVANWTWDLTGRMDATRYGGYGVSAVTEQPVRELQDGLGYRISVDLTDGESHPAPLFTVTYDYTFRAASVECVVTVQIHAVAGSPLFVKEPKLVAHCLRGYTQLDVLGPKDKLLDRRDLTLLPDPSHGTFQMGQVAREAVVLRGAGLPVFRVDCDRGLEQWADQADRAEPLLPDGARYCLKPDGRLVRRWESAHFRDRPWSGFMAHAWEGGVGYMDCLNASRAVGPARQYKTRLRYTLG